MLVGADSTIPAVVLAGQRSASSPLSEAAAVAADVMVPVAGRPALMRVIDALSGSQRVKPQVMIGPAQSVIEGSAELQRLLTQHDIVWQQPQGDPATSSIAGAKGLSGPVLITTGDHALLTPNMVDGFCVQAMNLDADFVVGLVPYSLVTEAFPRNRRTVLRFAGDPCCGSNLFLINRPEGVRALEFWRDMQRHRKHPQRIARALGVALLAKYLLRQLTLANALKVLSTKAGCQLAAVKISDPRAAVDVDSVADWHLADQILTADLQRA